MTSYKLKQVNFHGQSVSIVVQNENGPCPLLAIANILLLRGALKFPPAAPDVSLDRLMAMVAEYLLDHNQVDDSSSYAADLQKNLEDVMQALPKLATGVDVNPNFNSIKGFEFTNEVAIFDLFNVNLVHGWLVDPDDVRVAGELENLSYNQLVAKLVSILGTETPAHLLSPQTSFASAKTSSLTTAGVAQATRQTTMETEDQAPLIDLGDGEEEAGEPTAALVPEQNSDAAEMEGSSGKAQECVPAQEESSALVETEVQPPSESEDLIDLGAAADDVAGNSTVEGDGEVESTAQSTAETSPAVPEQNEGETLEEPSQEGSGSSRTLEQAAEKLAPEELEKRKREKELQRQFVSVVQPWLESNQLTVYGLVQLLEGVKEEEMAVFFRNNHFNTMYRRDGSLYILVTDQGYLGEPDVVWERLDNVDGDTIFCTAEFVPYSRAATNTGASQQDIDLQLALAASLEAPEDQLNQVPTQDQPAVPMENFSFPVDQQEPARPPPDVSADADLALAMHLEERERLEADREAARRRQQEEAQHMGRQHNRRRHYSQDQYERQQQYSQTNPHHRHAHSAAQAPLWGSAQPQPADEEQPNAFQRFGQRISQGFVKLFKKEQ